MSEYTHLSIIYRTLVRISLKAEIDFNTCTGFGLNRSIWRCAAFTLI